MATKRAAEAMASIAAAIQEIEEFERRADAALHQSKNAKTWGVVRDTVKTPALMNDWELEWAAFKEAAAFKAMQEEEEFRVLRRDTSAERC